MDLANSIKGQHLLLSCRQQVNVILNTQASSLSCFLSLFPIQLAKRLSFVTILR